MTTPSSSRLLYATSFALSLSVRGVSAQSSNTCTTDEFTSLNNKDGDTPCTVAQNLAAPCGGTLNTTQAGDNCSCNTVMYNLLSACALCNASPSASSEVLPDYPTWAAGCPGAVWDNYPDHGVADSAHVPRWAYDSPTKSGRFDLAQAVKSSESRHWTTMQILTPVIVALVFITSLGAAWIYHRRRRRRRRPAHQHSGSTGDEAAHDSLLETKGRRGSEVSLASGGSRLSAKSARGISARARRAIRRVFRPGVVSVKSQAAPTAFTIDGERAGDASHELDDLVSEEAKRPSAAPSPAPDGTPDLGGFGTGTGSGTARTRAKAAMLLAYVMSALGGSRGADYASVAEDGDDDVMNISASKRSVILVAREGHEDFSSQWTPTTSGSRGTSMVSPTRLSRAPSTMLSSPLSTRATHGSALTGSSGSRRSGPGMKPGSLASASMRTASGSASHHGHEQGRKWESRRETGSTDNRRASLEVVPPTPMSRRENPFTAYSPPTPKDSPTKRNAKPYRPPLPPLPSDSNLHSTYMTAASSVPTSPPVQSPPLLPSEAIVSNPPRYASPAHSRTSSYDSTASFSTAYPSPVASPRPLPQPLGLPPAAVPLPPSQTHSRTSSHTTLALAPLPPAPAPFLSPRATTPQPPSSTSSSSGGTLPSLSAFPAPPTALPQRTFRPSDPQNLIPAAVRGAGYNPYNGSPYGFAGPEE